MSNSLDIDQDRRSGSNLFAKVISRRWQGKVQLFFFSFWIPEYLQTGRVKSGNFGHQVNSDSDLVCFIF